VVAIDSSVAVAAFAPWHEQHEPAHELVAEGPSIPAHAVLETHSVLTRLPAPFRVAAELAAEFLDRALPLAVRLTLDGKGQRTTVESLNGLGVQGGAVYDGLIALTARAGSAELVTLDRRALTTYRRCDVPARLLA
jgi:predicted nucleic acid-binding protein